MNGESSCASDYYCTLHVYEPCRNRRNTTKSTPPIPDGAYIPENGVSNTYYKYTRGIVMLLPPLCDISMKYYTDFSINKTIFVAEFGF